jgi:hypothetical protein
MNVKYKVFISIVIVSFWIGAKDIGRRERMKSEDYLVCRVSPFNWNQF